MRVSHCCFVIGKRFSTICAVNGRRRVFATTDTTTTTYDDDDDDDYSAAAADADVRCPRPDAFSPLLRPVGPRERPPPPPPSAC